MEGNDFFYRDAEGQKQDAELWAAELGEDQEMTWDPAVDPVPQSLTELTTPPTTALGKVRRLLRGFFDR